MVEIADRRKKTQAQILGSDVIEEFEKLPFVIRPHRTNECRSAVAQPDGAFPLLGIRPDGKPRMALAFATRQRRDGDPCIDGDHRVLVRKQRIDIEFANLRHIGGELRELDEHEGYGSLIRGGHIAIGLEPTRDPCPRDQIGGQLEIERRQRQRLVVDDLHGGSAAPEQDDRPEGRIVGEANDQLPCFPAPDHRLNDDARHRSLGPQSRRAFEDFSDRLAHRVLVGDVELDATDIRFVDDIGRQDFDRDRSAVSEGRPGRFDSFFGRGRQNERRNRDVVCPQQGIHLQWIEPTAVGGDCPCDDRLRFCYIRHEIMRKTVGRLHQLVLCLAIANELDESPHRIRLGGKMRDANLLKNTRRFRVLSDPCGEIPAFGEILMRELVLTDPATAIAASVALATAVGTFRIRMASFSSSLSNASRATV